MLGVLQAGLGFAVASFLSCLFKPLLTVLVPLRIVKYTDFLSLVMVFTQPKKGMLSFYGKIELLLLRWGDGCPIWRKGLVFPKHGCPDLLGSPPHAGHVTTADCCPICVLKEPEHDIFTLCRSAWGPCRGVVLEFATCPTSFAVVIRVPKCDEGMFFPVDYCRVGVWSCQINFLILVMRL